MKYCMFMLIIAIGLRDATFGAQSDLKERVAQQVDRIKTISGYSDAGFFELPGASSGDDSSPIARLISYGMEAIPSLVPYLSDTSPTQAYRTHGSGMKRRALVNEYIILVINRIAEHRFYLPVESDSTQRNGIPNPALPTNISELGLQIQSWWQENRTKSLVERKIDDLNDPIHDNRFVAYEWVGRTKAREGRKPIEQRIDALLIGEVDTLKQSEMAACAEALSQIGDRDSAPQVRKVCEHLSYWLCEWHAAAGSNQIAALFKAYKALSNLGFKDEALSRMDVLKMECIAEMDKSVQEEFLKEFATLAYDQSHIQIKSKKGDQPTSTGFRLTAQAEKDVIGVSERLDLVLTIKNVSKKIGFIRETSPTEQYRLIVLDDRGRSVSLTTYGAKDSQPLRDHVGQMLKAIEPGEESRNKIEVRKLYDISSPGTYSITASRIVYDKDANETGSVKSNAVSVRVAR